MEKPGLTDEDRSLIERHARKPRFQRRPEDLIPASNDEPETEK